MQCYCGNFQRCQISRISVKLTVYDKIKGVMLLIRVLLKNKQKIIGQYAVLKSAINQSQSRERNQGQGHNFISYNEITKYYTALLMGCVLQVTAVAI